MKKGFPLHTNTKIGARRIMNMAEEYMLDTKDKKVVKNEAEKPKEDKEDASANEVNQSIKEFGQMPVNNNGASPIHCITIIG